MQQRVRPILQNAKKFSFSSFFFKKIIAYNNVVVTVFLANELLFCIYNYENEDIFEHQYKIKLGEFSSKLKRQLLHSIYRAINKRERSSC
jgi:hypothetical protein